MAIRNWLAWRFLRGRVKRVLTQGEVMDFLTGSKTKIGAFGALLATIGAVLARFQGAEVDVDFAMTAARDLFLALGGYGGLMKIMRIIKNRFDE